MPFRRLGDPLFSMGLGERLGLGNRVTAGGVPWYLAVGVTPLAVWVAKGAASLAASKVNLVTPGIHDLTDGVAPTLQADGWLGNSSAYLFTDIVPTLTYTLAIRVSGQNDAIRAHGGVSSSATQNFLIRNSGAGNVNFQNGNQQVYAAAFATNEVVVIAGKTVFVNGVQQTSVSAGGSNPTHVITLIGYNNAGVITARLSQGNMQAAAIWNTTLTPAQALVVSASMALL